VTNGEAESLTGADPLAPSLLAGESCGHYEAGLLTLLQDQGALDRLRSTRAQRCSEVWRIESHGALRIATTFDLVCGQRCRRCKALCFGFELLRLVGGSCRFLANQVRVRRRYRWRFLPDSHEQGMQLQV